MIEIKNLHKKFGDREVLKGIDLNIEKGKVIAIIGPSGTGKSTLLRCLNVLERADSGFVKIADKEVDFSNLTKDDIQMLRTRTAMVFQNSNLYRNKTVIENVMEPLIVVKKVAKDEARKIAKEQLEKVGMLHKESVYPETLSGGEKQRVGIARAMGVNSDIILFDEPTSALDPELVGEVLDVIKNLAKQHTTMLIVTHEMKFAKEVADEVIFMENGYIVEKAPAKEFFNNPKEERTKRFINKNVDTDIVEKDTDKNILDEGLNFDKDNHRNRTNSYKWKNLKERSIDDEIYPMWVADMEFKSPPAVLKRLQNRIEEGVMGYEVLSDEYYDSVSYWLDKRHSYKVNNEDIVCCADATIAMSVFIQRFTEPGDEILINSPVYGGFLTTIEGCGRKVIESPLKNNNGKYTLDFEDMEKLITPKTKVILICNPQNPTGTVWSEKELEELCGFSKKHNLYIISDEVHYDFIFNGKNHIMTAKISEKMGIDTFTIISPGKTFNISGTRAASIIIKNKEMREKFNEYMSKMKYPFCHDFVEAATVGAYMESEEWFEEVKSYIAENRQIFEQFINDRLTGLSVAKGDSTYLMWVDCSGLNLSDEELEILWKEKCKLILSNGSEFGTGYNQFRRINIACQIEKLISILNRIEKVFKNEGYIG